MRFKGLAAFDLDGTLVDSWRDIYLATTLALEEAGLEPLEPEFVQARTGYPPDQFFIGACEEWAIPGLVRAFRKHLATVVGTFSSVYPDTMSSLTRLKEEGWAVALASNKPLPLALLALDHAGLDASFDHMVGPDRHLRPKPEPDMLLNCLEATGTKSGAYIGDTSLDIAAGKAAGSTTILIASLEVGPPATPLEPAPDHIVAALSDIHSLLPRDIS